MRLPLIDACKVDSRSLARQTSMLEVQSLQRWSGKLRMTCESAIPLHRLPVADGEWRVGLESGTPGLGAASLPADAGLQTETEAEHD